MMQKKVLCVLRFFSLAAFAFGMSTGCSSNLQFDLLKTNIKTAFERNILSYLTEADAEANKKPYAIVISIDGYREDFTKRYAPPTLNRIKSHGSSADALIPSFPPDTFPNHYSIATGMYTENHGIVANHFFDPARKAYYKVSNPLAVRDGSWYGGVPFWVAAERQGIVSATFFWPGSEAEIQGTRPTYFYYYDESIPNLARVDQIKTLLELPASKRPHLVTVYFSTVDTAGHKFGPETPQMQKAVLEVDAAIARLVKNTEDLKLPVNFFIVSDHGMQQLREYRAEYLEDYVDVTELKTTGDISRFSMYFDDEAKMEKVYSVLKQKGKHFNIYKRSEMPARYHYSKNPRCGDLIVVAQAPYLVHLKRKVRDSIHAFSEDHGGHGYDPLLTLTMHGIFYAMGPAIKERGRVPAFENVHIYPLLLKVLGINVLGNIDGDLKVLSPLLNEN